MKQQAETGFRTLLRDRGFHSFLWTQFLGAFNDNLCKMVVSMRAVDVAAGSGGKYLALAGAVFVLPFLLFSGYAGRLADAMSKRRVLIAVKAFEIGVMGLGIAVFLSTRIELMLAVLFLMALHSTVFSPAKYGIVPEIVADGDLSRANALLEMSTFVAIVLGTAVGSVIFARFPKIAGPVMLGVAVTGFVTSLRITRVRPSGAAGGFQWNPFAEVIAGTKQLRRDWPLFMTVIAISYFWFLGALFQMDLLLFGKEVLHASDLRVGLMVTCLALGIGAGSMLAGRWSGDKVELGLVPLGSLGMGAGSVALYLARGSYAWSVASLAFLGIASGLFIVPLNAFLQQRGAPTEKGRLIATNNFWNTVGLLAASATLWSLQDVFKVGADRIVLWFGLATVVVTVLIADTVPDFLVRFVLWLLTHTFYRIRVRGAQNVPQRGPALIVANHVSHVDGFLIGACIQRFLRFMVWRPYYESKALGWFLRLTKCIPVGAALRENVASIRQAREELARGHVVCIFAEGAITRTGNMLPFHRGFEKIAEGMDVPIVPVHLDGVWGSIFSFAGGRFFRKWPRRIPYPVTVTFGAPMAAASTAQEVRQAIQELGSECAAARQTASDTLPLRAVRSLRKNWGKLAMADSTGRELTSGRALAASVLLARWVRRHCAGQEMIGLVLPASCGGALANIAVAMAGKVAVNLNFTAGREAMESAAAQCGLKTILTAKAFLAKAKIGQMAAMVFVEDILAVQTGGAKLRALIAARMMPARWLVARQSPDSPATVIFSSGSTGVPKGVVLSHYNIISNIEAIAQVFPIGAADRIVGSLPFFHSFGFTVTIWFPLLAGSGVVYHPNPLDAKGIGALVEKYRATFLLSTPTFCAGYVRKCAPREFASLRHVLVGAEKLREPVARAFRETFGVEPREGYGSTEMAPVVAVNTPDFDGGRYSQTGTRAGTVGHPLPGVAVKIVDAETFAPLGADREGLLLVKGPNRMLGYLGRPDLTAEALRDGWYNTGDIAMLDDDGFVRITDRLSRFSKIAGEMVPHLKVEEAIAPWIGEHRALVTGIPDGARGERLVALYTDPALAPVELWRRLQESDLPRLWTPKREDIFQVEAIPVLGSGKIDLRGARKMAVELAGEKVSVEYAN